MWFYVLYSCKALVMLVGGFCGASAVVAWRRLREPRHSLVDQTIDPQTNGPIFYCACGGYISMATQLVNERPQVYVVEATCTKIKVLPEAKVV